jgi:hypothetical protein
LIAADQTEAAPAEADPTFGLHALWWLKSEADLCRAGISDAGKQAKAASPAD